MGARRLAGLLRRVWVCGAGVLFGVVGVFGVVLVFGCAPASAALQYPFVGELSGVNLVASVAVDDESGDVLVGEHPSSSIDAVVQEFDAAGGRVAVWTGSGTPAGSFGETALFVAADDASGRVYVADSARRVVDVFEASGGYVCQITGAGSGSTSPSECDTSAAGAPGGAFRGLEAVAVDQATGEVYVAEAHVIDRFSAAGVFLSQITGASTPAGSFADVSSLAVDDESGDLLIRDGAVVYVFDVATGSYVATWNGSAASNPPGVPGGFGNPYRVAVDDSTGDVYVTDSEHEVVDQFGPAGEYLGQIAAFAGGRSLSDPGAIAVDQASGRLYFSESRTLVGRGNEELIDVIGDRPVVVADVRTGAASEVKAESVVLEGGVDPDGIAVSACRFEYGTSTSYGQSVPCVGSVGSGSSEVAVHAELVGLAPDTTYHYRVAASNANGTNYGSDGEVTTLAVPVIDSVSSSSLTGSSVNLDAQIDPKGVDTTYRFEYGASAAYGQSVPVPDSDIGAGESDVAVSQHVGGLSAGSTYHFRVVAHSANGTAVSLDHTLVYLAASSGLPDGRAYELVTPAFKDGALVGDVFFGASATVSEDGSRIMVTSLQPFGGAGSGTGERALEGDPYEFTRTNGGWVTSALAPPATQVQSNTYWFGSAESDVALFSGPSSPGAPDSFYVREADGSLVDLGPASPASAGSGYVGAQDERMGFSTDLSHLVFTLVEGSEFWPFDDTSRAGLGQESVYEYVGAGGAQPSLVGVSGGADSTDLIGVCGTLLGSESSLRFGAVSADGDTVFFTVEPCSSGSGANTGVPVPAAALYARIDGSQTVALSQRSPSDCASTACQDSPPSAAVFQQASSDGSKVFFTSLQQLTDQASEDADAIDTSNNCPATRGANGCNLYEYDFGAPVGESLTAISAGDTSGGGPRVQGVTAVSADGSHAYFVAKGVLSAAANAQGQSPVAGADNLYLYEHDAAYPSGRTVFIATLPASDSLSDWDEGISRYANVTPDGRFLVFTSHGDLTADDTSQTGAAQVFRYDAVTGSLVRISIGERGFNDDGNAALGDAALVPANSPFRLDPTMSNDGSYVFFMSPAALVPGALDDVPIEGREGEGGAAYAQNVYEYHEGNVYLISDGRDTASEGNPSKVDASTTQLIGVDGSGANVFFQTADSLVPQDTNTGMDVYDARVCTTAEPCLAPPAVQAACAGEACLGAPSGAPAFGAPASASFAGAGNLASKVGVTAGASKPKQKTKPKKKTKKARKKKGKRKGRGRGKSSRVVKSTRGRK